MPPACLLYCMLAQQSPPPLLPPIHPLRTVQEASPKALQSDSKHARCKAGFCTGQIQGSSTPLLMFLGNEHKCRRLKTQFAQNGSWDGQGKPCATSYEPGKLASCMACVAPGPSPPFYIHGTNDTCIPSMITKSESDGRGCMHNMKC